MTPPRELGYSKAALKYLAGINNDELRNQIADDITDCFEHPEAHEMKKVQGVTTKEGEPVLRVRSGDYRILFAYRKNPRLFDVLLIGHRKEIYKNLPKKI